MAIVLLRMAPKDMHEGMSTLLSWLAGPPINTPRCDHRGLPTLWGAPDASALPRGPRHPPRGRELGLPPVLRNTMPTQHPVDVSQLMPREPIRPLLDAPCRRATRSTCIQATQGRASLKFRVRQLSQPSSSSLRGLMASRIVRPTVASTLLLVVAPEPVPKGNTCETWQSHRSHRVPRDNHLDVRRPLWA